MLWIDLWSQGAQQGRQGEINSILPLYKELSQSRKAGQGLQDPQALLETESCEWRMVLSEIIVL